MTIHEAIKKLLTTNAPVAALVVARVYPNVLPQSLADYPAVSFRNVYREGIEKLDDGGEEGEPRGSSGLAWMRFRVFSTAKGPGEYGTAVRLDRLCRLALQGFAGEVASDDSPIDVCEVQGIFKVDGTTRDLWDDKTQTYQRFSDFEVWYTEEQPVKEADED